MQDLCQRSLYDRTLGTISGQDLLDYENEHRATASDEKVARAISKFAQRRNESALTGPECSDRPRVLRGFSKFAPRHNETDPARPK